MLGLPTTSTSPVLKQVTFYVMSSNDQMGMKIGNFWTTLDDFPVYTSQYWYLTNEKNTKPKDRLLSLTSPNQTCFPLHHITTINTTITTLSHHLRHSLYHPTIPTIPNTTNTTAAASTSSSYLYDPSNPFPTHGGNNLFLPCGHFH